VESQEGWIVSHSEVLGGKPCIRGTRISVEHLLELLASGASRDEILRAYPHVPSEGFIAALRYAARTLHGESVWEATVSA
jgi:uncharacterized protein (DUF433 family)